MPDEATCFWERVSGFDREPSDSITNGSAAAGQPVINATDAGFQSDGCGTQILLA